MLIPKGVPEDPKARIERQVKSGFKNLSFSKLSGQGIFFKNSGAYSTNLCVIALYSLLTKEANPSHSALTYLGSKYDSINPMLVSTIGPISLTQDL